LTAADTSVVVAAFASWHEGHRPAVVALARAPRLPAHVYLESFSVLTRLPPPHRAPAAVVADFLAARFPEAALLLPGREHQQLLRDAVRHGVAGGAVYDALIAATARRAGALLLTRDRRAVAVYERFGVRYEMVV
jgi:predicted nucleic acid-binding protein